MEKIKKRIQDQLDNNNELVVWEVKDENGLKNFALYFDDKITGILIFKYELVDSVLKPSLNINQEFFNTFSIEDRRKILRGIRSLDRYVAEEYRENINLISKHLKSWDWEGLINAIQSN